MHMNIESDTANVAQPDEKYNYFPEKSETLDFVPNVSLIVGGNVGGGIFSNVLYSIMITADSAFGKAA